LSRPSATRCSETTPASSWQIARRNLSGTG